MYLVKRFERVLSISKHFIVANTDCANKLVHRLHCMAIPSNQQD